MTLRPRKLDRASRIERAFAAIACDPERAACGAEPVVNGIDHAGIKHVGSTDPASALQNLFSQIDANGDGQITKSEFENALGAGGTNLAAADDVFSQLDTNGDGTVSLSEMKSALQGGHHGGHHHVHADSSTGSADGSSGSSTTNGSAILRSAAAGIGRFLGHCDVSTSTNGGTGLVLADASIPAAHADLDIGDGLRPP